MRTEGREGPGAEMFHVSQEGKQGFTSLGPVKGFWVCLQAPRPSLPWRWEVGGGRWAGNVPLSSFLAGEEQPRVGILKLKSGL